RNGKRPDSGSSGSFFSWFVVLALLGVWTSVAVVYFDLVDYQGVLGECGPLLLDCCPLGGVSSCLTALCLHADKAKGLHLNLSQALQGKLVAYDADGDGDFDVEDAKILLG
ncbi:unnamed protein product, partial [Tetraodon nigroviridis]